MKARWARWTCAAVAAFWAAAAVYYGTRALPAGMRLHSKPQQIPARAVAFLADITGADAYDHGFSSHTIFDAMLRNIGAARNVVLLDCRLCTDLHRHVPGAVAELTPMGTQLLNALLARKAAVPGLQVLLIADPVNALYGAAPPAVFDTLRAAGIQVVQADLGVLRDRNVLYGAPWRATLKWWSHADAGGGWLPNPFSDEGPPLTARAWAALANLKSSGRRLLITDGNDGALIALLGTAEPAMARSIDTVTALQVSGAAVQSLLASELELAHAMGWGGSIIAPAAAPGPVITATDTLQLQWLGEGAIRDALLDHIAATSTGDSIDIATASLTERAVIAALLAASRRGVSVRMILDPQKTRSLWGRANQSVGSELISDSDGHVHIAWYRTHTEQFRAALVLIHGGAPTWMLAGSAGLSRRDLGDYDLALDAALTGPAGATPFAGAQMFFDTLWNDRGPPGIEYTADADAWADPSQLRYWAYRLMEQLGISRT